MGWRPWEFWNATPEEFSAAVEGFTRQQAREWHRTAWMVAYLISPWVKKGSVPVTPERLLGPGMMAVLRRRSHAPVTDEGED